jgi:hypothetical protein
MLVHEPFADATAPEYVKELRHLLENPALLMV